MSGKNSVVHAFYIFHQEFDFISEFPWQAVPCCIGNIYYRSSGFDNRFHHTCQIHIIGTSGIFAIKFHIFHILFGILYSCNGTFQNFFLSRVEFMFNMKLRSSDTGMNTFVLCVLECFGGYIYIFLNSTCQRANRRPGYGFGYFNYRFKIART